MASARFVAFGPQAVNEALTALQLPIREASDNALRCKTLGLVGDGCLAVAVLGVGAQLSLRKAAEALGAKELRLAKRRDLPRLFGFEAQSLQSAR